MHEEPRADRTETGVRHEPIVSESLERSQAENRQAAESSREETAAVRAAKEEMREDAAPGEKPLKEHGDALLEGSGNRHGVDARGERPAT